MGEVSEIEKTSLSSPPENWVKTFQSSAQKDKKPDKLKKSGPVVPREYYIKPKIAYN
jgi:hypothetical protein